MMIVADDAGDLPASLRSLPQRYQLGGAAVGEAAAVRASVAEPVDSRRYRTVASQRIDLEGSYRMLPGVNLCMYAHEQAARLPNADAIDPVDCRIRPTACHSPAPRVAR